MKKRQAFTLIELIIVVIVIGILATLAVPQYMKATERAKIAKAKNAIALISKAEKLYRAENDTYITTSDWSNAGPLDPYVELTDIASDGDWTYGAVGDTSTFTVTAKRVLPSMMGACTITLDQNNSMTDNCVGTL